MSEDWPDCKTHQEMQCIYNNGLYEPKIEANLGRCLRPSTAMTYKAEVLVSPPRVENDYFSIWFKYMKDRCPKLDGYAIANFGVRVEPRIE